MSFRKPVSRAKRRKLGRAKSRADRRRANVQSRSLVARESSQRQRSRAGRLSRYERIRNEERVRSMEVLARLVDKSGLHY